jgi:hypothetical protein
MTRLRDAVIGLVRPVNTVWAFTSSSFTKLLYHPQSGFIKEAAPEAARQGREAGGFADVRRKAGGGRWEALFVKREA